MGGRSKLPVLLTEMVLMLLIFALAAAVCLGIFAASRSAAISSEELGRASAWAQSAAEAYRAARGDADAACAVLGAEPLSGGDGFVLYLDKDWQPTGAEGGAYCLKLTETGGSDASVSVIGGGETAETLFSMDVRVVAYG